MSQQMLRHLMIANRLAKKRNIVPEDKVHKLKEHKELLTQFGVNSPTTRATKPGRKKTISSINLKLNNPSLH